MKLNIANSTDKTLYFLIYGLSGQEDSAHYGYVDTSGNFNNWTTTGSKLSDFTALEASESITIDSMPTVSSGIILLCYGAKPSAFNVVDTKSTQWHGLGVQAPSYLPEAMCWTDIFQMVEFTYLPDNGGLWANTTQVDYLCMPWTLSVTNSAGVISTSGQLKSGVTRASIFDSFKQLGAPWDKLVLSENGHDIRVIAPQHGIAAELFPADYFAPYIDKIWNQYQPPAQLQVNTTQGLIIGASLNTGLTFNAPGQEIVFQKPTSTDVFACAGTLAAPNDLRGEIARALGAGFNRSVLQNPSQPYCNMNDFYQLNAADHSLSNLYSKIMHDSVVGGQAYGFPFDDVCGYSSTLHDTNPTEMKVEVPALS